MSKSFREDLTGQRFGRLTVIEFVPNDKRHSCWKCKCDCGQFTVVQQNYLKSGKTVSCGCFQKDVMSKHKLWHTRIYRIWASMKKRCYNANRKEYKWYGGRGITVCDEWEDNFKAFYDWAMANGYTDDLTIDRIDNDKGYCPENCRWADMKTQRRNQRRQLRT